MEIKSGVWRGSEPKRNYVKWNRTAMYGREALKRGRKGRGLLKQKGVERNGESMTEVKRVEKNEVEEDRRALKRSGNQGQEVQRIGSRWSGVELEWSGGKWRGNCMLKIAVGGFF